MRFLKTIFLVAVALLGSGCSYQPISKQTGGHGQVLASQVPLSAVKVSITDLAGTLSAFTDAHGRFNIPVESKKVLFLAMSNPMKHHVTVAIERDGVVIKQWRFIKKELGPNYFDFGVIHVGSRPNNSFKPKPLRDSA
jgi:hypothetical protein